MTKTHLESLDSGVRHYDPREREKARGRLLAMQRRAIFLGCSRPSNDHLGRRHVRRARVRVQSRQKQFPFVKGIFLRTRVGQRTRNP
jgi:hypothetical protein